MNGRENFFDDPYCSRHVDHIRIVGVFDAEWGASKQRSNRHRTRVFDGRFNTDFSYNQHDPIRGVQ